MPSDNELDTMQAAQLDAIDTLLKDTFETDMEATLVKNLRGKDEIVAEHLLPLNDDEDETELLAYIGYTDVEVEGGDDKLILGLGPMAVKGSEQRKGVGIEFLAHSIDAMKEAGVDAIVLLGHTGFYSHAGFRPAADYGLIFSDDNADMNDAFMVLELKDDALEGCSGKVTYPADFY